MLMIFMEILQLECYAVPELPPSRNPLHNCTYGLKTHPDSRSPCITLRK